MSPKILKRTTRDNLRCANFTKPSLVCNSQLQRNLVPSDSERVWGGGGGVGWWVCMCGVYVIYMFSYFLFQATAIRVTFIFLYFFFTTE